MTKKKVDEMKKVNKREKVTDFSASDLDGKLDDVIAKFELIKKDFDGYFDFSIESDTEYGYYQDSWTVLNVYAFRKETDVEREKRIEKKKKDAASKRALTKQKKLDSEASDKKEFIRLSKKFKNLKCNISEKQPAASDFKTEL